ncbi:MAG: hypothetical protein JXJ18_02160 [Rhodobacteraceae bacterium]|nr:hypothetical protein [Paracoccaceae bacterium]
MKLMTLTLLAATTALTAAIGAPGWSATRATGDPLGLLPAAALGAGQDALPLDLASADDDDDHKYRNGARRERDDDDDDACEDEDGDDDDCADNARNAAPAGTVAPPLNGLFGNGALPKAQTN